LKNKILALNFVRFLSGKTIIWKIVEDSRWRGNGEKRKPWELRPCRPASSAARYTYALAMKVLSESASSAILQQRLSSGFDRPEKSLYIQYHI
jgi:hypothetical protein